MSSRLYSGTAAKAGAHGFISEKKTSVVCSEIRHQEKSSVATNGHEEKKDSIKTTAATRKHLSLKENAMLDFNLPTLSSPRRTVLRFNSASALFLAPEASNYLVLHILLITSIRTT